MGRRFSGISRPMPSFSVTPISVDYPISISDNNDEDEEEEENRIDTVAIALAQQHKNTSSNKKQLMLIKHVEVGKVVFFEWKCAIYFFFLWNK